MISLLYEEGFCHNAPRLNGVRTLLVFVVCFVYYIDKRFVTCTPVTSLSLVTVYPLFILFGGLTGTNEVFQRRASERLKSSVPPLTFLYFRRP